MTLRSRRKSGIMSATEVIDVFIPNSSISIENCAPGIQRCIPTMNRCTAYKIEPSMMGSKRTGIFWADMFTFKRVTTTEGWEFKGLVAIVDNIVVYRDPAGGRPLLGSEAIQKKPLGPLQDIGGLLQDTTQGLFS